MNPRCVKVEWCEQFIRATFTKYHASGIEVGLFWRMAEKSGLWAPGIYGGPMSQALERLTTVRSVRGADGRYAYSAFRLREEAAQDG